MPYATVDAVCFIESSTRKLVHELRVRVGVKRKLTCGCEVDGDSSVGSARGSQKASHQPCRELHCRCCVDANTSARGYPITRSMKRAMTRSTPASTSRFERLWRLKSSVSLSDYCKAKQTRIVNRECRLLRAREVSGVVGGRRGESWQRRLGREAAPIEAVQTIVSVRRTRTDAMRKSRRSLGSGGEVVGEERATTVGGQRMASTLGSSPDDGTLCYRYAAQPPQYERR